MTLLDRRFLDRPGHDHLQRCEAADPGNRHQGECRGLGRLHGHRPHYSCFQRLNLRQTQTDRAIAKPVQVDGSVITDLIALLGNGLTRNTMRRLASQLLSERRASIHRVRRPILQAPVAFDVFRHALIHTGPDFCTFFTNHVAGIMHRYWKYAFPKDFQYELQGEADKFHRESLLIALDYADEHIGFLMCYVDARRGRLYIASSMGQQAVHQEQEVEVCIDSPVPSVSRGRSSY